MAAEDNESGLMVRLRQHHIYRAVVAYAVIAWVIVQVASIVFPSFALPASAVRILILVLVLLFPLVLVAVWLFVKPGDPKKQKHLRRRHWMLASVLTLAVLALVVLSGWYIWGVQERHAEQAAALVAAAPASATPLQAVASDFQPPPDSIVVLPFANLSGESEQRYFSDGITEELTNALGQIPALRVIAWGTASAYRDTRESVASIGKALNVANLLHGSVLRQGERVRVTVELVNTATGYQLWSDHYDASLDDLFSVQDRISNAIAEALRIEFSDPHESSATANSEAHEFVLKGLGAMDIGTAGGYREAQKYFTLATVADPAYAAAWGWLAHTYISLSDASTLPLETALAQADTAAEKALALDPDNVPALVAKGTVYALTNRVEAARAVYQRALALDPSDAAAHANYGLLLPLKASLAQTQAAVRLDPHSVVAQNNLASTYIDLEKYAQAIEPLRAILQLESSLIGPAFSLAFVYRKLGEPARMVAVFDQVEPASEADRRLVAAGQLTYQSLTEPEVRKQALAALARLRKEKLSPDQQSHVIQMRLALGMEGDALQLLTLNCAASPAGCADLAINPLYKPLHGNADFERLARRYTTMTME